MDNFKEMRLNLGITQAELAEKSGISLRQLVCIENKECIPNLETRILLYKALNVNEKDIINYIVNNYIKI